MPCTCTLQLIVSQLGEPILKIFKTTFEILELVTTASIFSPFLYRMVYLSLFNEDSTFFNEQQHQLADHENSWLETDKSTLPQDYLKQPCFFQRSEAQTLLSLFLSSLLGTPGVADIHGRP